MLLPHRPKSEKEDHQPDFEKVLLSFKAIDFLMKNLSEEPSKVLDAIKYQLERAVFCLIDDIPPQLKNTSFENDYINLDLDKAKLLNGS